MNSQHKIGSIKSWSHIIPVESEILNLTRIGSKADGVSRKEDFPASSHIPHWLSSGSFDVAMARFCLRNENGFVRIAESEAVSSAEANGSDSLEYCCLLFAARDIWELFASRTLRELRQQTKTFIPPQTTSSEILIHSRSKAKQAASSHKNYRKPSLQAHCAATR